ncbi:hypothetical protein DPMN_061524 [Dreissena polymorpha]|uniref:Uncharacterized protein n=1 Tax=Dreissena polymorpha TaxID=45954 RepID=A0A9D4C770_DREPO|nr:hypothetical protein DPMN_061524 [Dreissena polymorpha]
MYGYITEHCGIQPGVTGLSMVCVGISQITVGYSLESQGSLWYVWVYHRSLWDTAWSHRALYCMCGYITDHCGIQPGVTGLSMVFIGISQITVGYSLES